MIHLAFAGFLFGSLAVAVPVILHFLKRKPTEDDAFPSFMFLGASAKVAQRKNSLRKWLLLLLRCLAFILLSAAFAWPYIPAFDEKPESATVLLWDASLSMSAKPCSAELLAAAKAEIAKADAKNPLLIGAVGAKTVWSGKPSADAAGLSAWLDAHSSSFSSSSFASALAMADARLQAIDAPKKRVALVTDRQALPWKELRGEPLLSEGVELKVLTPKQPGFKNVALTSVRQASPFSKTGATVCFDVEVSNFSKDPVSGKLSLFLDDLEEAKTSASLKPFETTQFRLSVKPRTLQVFRGRAEFDATDDLPQDNSRFFVLAPGAEPLVVATPATGPDDFLRVAFQPSPQSNAAEFKTVKVQELNEASLSKASLLILREGVAANSEAGKAVEQYIAKGGVAATIWREGKEMRETLARHGVRCALQTKRQTVQFGEIDFDDPLFKSFLETKVGGLFDVRFKAPPSLIPPEEARVLASFKDGRPAIFELPSGKGRILVVATQLDRKSSDWPAAPSFLPFWRELLAISAKAGQESEALQLKAGAPCPWKAPDGSPPDVSKPGCVKLLIDGKEKMAPVDIPPEESNPALLPESFEFAKIVGAKPAKDDALAKSAGGSEPSDKGAPLWRWALLLALLLLVSETLLANRTAL